MYNELFTAIKNLGSAVSQANQLILRRKGEEKSRGLINIYPAVSTMLLQDKIRNKECNGYIFKIMMLDYSIEKLNSFVKVYKLLSSQGFSIDEIINKLPKKYKRVKSPTVLANHAPILNQTPATTVHASSVNATFFNKAPARQLRSRKSPQPQ